jgi:hypothetical protein
MLERDRIALRQAKAEIAAQEAAEREAEERPIREATAQLNETHRELFKVMQERLLQMEDVDGNGVSQVYVEQGYIGLAMDWGLAMALNADNYKEFLRDNSSWYWHDPAQNNMRQLFGYLERNSVFISSPEMLKRAALRLDYYHLLELRPPEPPAPPRPYVNLTVEETPAPPTYTGWDEATGDERQFTQRQVDLMSADQYRRLFRVKRSDMILPNSGPGPMGYQA